VRTVVVTALAVLLCTALAAWAVDATYGVLRASQFIGPLLGDVSGNTTGLHTGPVTGNVTGSVTGSLTGNVTGNVTGNLTGNSSGSHTGAVNGTINPLVFSGSDLGAQINAAMAANPGGAIIQIPPGQYSFSTTIQCPVAARVAPFILQGAGRGNEATDPTPTKLVYTGTGTAIDQTVLSTTYQNIAGCEFRNFKLDGTNAGSSAIGISFGGTDSTALTHITITRFKGAGVQVRNAAGLWTERYSTYEINLWHNKVGWKWQCDSGCSPSWGHFHMYGVHVNVGPELGLSAPYTGFLANGAANVYDGNIDVSGNIEGSNNDSLFSLSNSSGIVDTVLTNDVECNETNCVLATTTTGGFFATDYVMPWVQSNWTDVTPTASSCGSGSSFDPNSTMFSGEVHMGSGATNCTLTFPHPFNRAPRCTVTDDGNPLGHYISAKGAGGFTINCMTSGSPVSCGAALAAYFCSDR